MPERLKDVVFVIEATSFEQLALWKEHSKQGKGIIDWEEDNSGYAETVGEFGGYPVVINVSFARLNGYRIMFYYAMSKVVNHDMIKDWLKNNCNPKQDEGTRDAHADAMNFSHAIHYVTG